MFVQPEADLPLNSRTLPVLNSVKLVKGEEPEAEPEEETEPETEASQQSETGSGKEAGGTED